MITTMNVKCVLDMWFCVKEKSMSHAFLKRISSRKKNILARESASFFWRTFVSNFEATYFPVYVR